MLQTKFITVVGPLLAGNELVSVIETVSTGWISFNGKYVKAFEDAFVQYYSVKYGVGNRTVAQHLAFVALGMN